MHSFNAGRLFNLVNGFTVIAHAYKPGLQNGFFFPKKDFEDMQDRTNELCDKLKALELTSTLASANIMKDVIERVRTVSARDERPAAIPPGEWALFEPAIAFKFSDAASSIVSRFCDEMSSRRVLTIRAHSAHLYDSSSPPFGDEVFRKFQAATEDISEAGKCYALGRYTATVFHLMRAMELAIQVLADKIGATVRNKDGQPLTWGIILSNMDGKIKDMPPGDLKKAWSEARAQLYHVNQAWRTETMHPKQTYTEEESKDVWDATGSFMRQLAALI